jgi:hypothetical protein
MIPILRDTYWALGSHSVGYLALHQVPEMGCVLLLCAATFIFLREHSDRQAVLCLLSASVFASFAYDVQRTNWGYHLLPMIAFILMAAAILIIIRMGSFLIRHDAPISPVLLGTVVVVLCTFTILEIRIVPQDELPKDGGAFSGLTSGDAVFVFSTGGEIFPVAYRRNLEWGSRFPCLWILPALIRNSPGGSALVPPDVPFKAIPKDRLVALSTMQRTQMAEDLDHWKPKVVLVQRCPCDFIYSDHFDMLEWFGASPRFQKSWSHYVHTSGMAGFDVYRRTND